jgi:hypothetical protein
MAMTSMLPLQHIYVAIATSVNDSHPEENLSGGDKSHCTHNGVNEYSVSG